MGKTASLETSPAHIPTRRNVHADADAIALYWLGQAGFLIEFRGTRIVIDPYLSDSLHEKYKGTKFPHVRLMPPPLEAAKLGDIDFVLVTHGHSDHLDPGTLPTLQSSSPGCRFIVPRSCEKLAIDRGIDESRVDPIDAETTRALAESCDVTAIASAHETRKVDELGNELYLGYVLKLEDIVIYHSGDCIPYDGLSDRLSAELIDVCLLPINGRDSERSENGVPGNFTLDEAAELSEIVGAKYMIGHHFGMFAFNTIDLNESREHIDRMRPVSNSRVLLAELGVKYAIIAGPKR